MSNFQTMCIGVKIILRHFGLIFTHYDSMYISECSPIKNTEEEDELLYCSVLNGETYEAIQIEPCSGQCQNRRKYFHICHCGRSE